jgi:hypothetical protein
MGLFNRNRPRPAVDPAVLFRKPLDASTPAPPASPQASASASTPFTAPDVDDWSSSERIRGEWTELESPSEGLLGWRNGMRLYDDGPIPAQRFNVAEYLSRGLSRTLYASPLFSDDEAAETVRRMLRLIETMPAEPAALRPFAGRLARLALEVTRQKHWQPAAFGGDGRITAEILSADRTGLVGASVSAPGIPAEDYLRHFFDD